MVSAMKLWGWFMTIGSAVLALGIGYHVLVWHSLNNQFPELGITTAMVLPPPCGSGHFFGTYVHKPRDASGNKGWMHACRDWQAQKWILVELD
jgi:hypothetical protein